MSNARIKNIIIIALVLLNAFLLVILCVDRAETRSVREREIEALAEVLDQRKITISPDLEFDVEAPKPCVIYRDEKKDDDLVDNLIDYSYREDMGGNVIFYSSDRGQAMMRGTGEMILIFNEDLPELGSDQLRSSARYVERKGVALYEDLAEYVPAGEGATVSSPCAVDGYCVYNSRLVFNISGGRLMMIDGIRAFDGRMELQEEETIDSVSALMYFLDTVRNEGIICREICGLEAGYFMNVAVLGECTLRPVWKVITDTGDIYINALSGKHEILTMG